MQAFTSVDHTNNTTGKVSFWLSLSLSLTIFQFNNIFLFSFFSIPMFFALSYVVYLLLPVISFIFIIFPGSL